MPTYTRRLDWSGHAQRKGRPAGKPKAEKPRDMRINAVRFYNEDGTVKHIALHCNVDNHRAAFQRFEFRLGRGFWWIPGEMIDSNGQVADKTARAYLLEHFDRTRDGEIVERMQARQNKKRRAG